MMKSLMLAAALIAALPVAAKPLQIGAKVPDFSLPASDGQTYKLSQFKGKIVVVEWFNTDCPYVHKFSDSHTMQNLQKEATSGGVTWLTVISSVKGKEGYLEPAEAAKVRLDKEMANTALLLDGDGKVGRLYSAKTTPHMFVIDKTGKLAYEGAMDDRPSTSPKSLDGAQNYVSLALKALQAGSAIRNASTTPYGCRIHY
jgi:peroxiredoxin